MACKDCDNKQEVINECEKLIDICKIDGHEVRKSIESCDKDTTMFRYRSNSELFIDEYDNKGIWTGNTTKVEKDSVWVMDEEESLNGEVKLIQKTENSISIEIDADTLTEYFTIIREAE